MSAVHYCDLCGAVTSGKILELPNLGPRPWSRGMGRADVCDACFDRIRGVVRELATKGQS